MKIISLLIVTNDCQIFEGYICDFENIALNHNTLRELSNIAIDDVYDTGWRYSDGHEEWRSEYNKNANK